jgi:hypothetical protein
MTPMAGLLAVATVFIGLWTQISQSEKEWGLYARQTRNLSRGAYAQGGGRGCGILQYYTD